MVLPSSSSFSKLVLSMERVPPRSTTASSSVLWKTHTEEYDQFACNTNININIILRFRAHTFNKIWSAQRLTWVDTIPVHLISVNVKKIHISSKRYKLLRKRSPPPAQWEDVSRNDNTHRGTPTSTYCHHGFQSLFSFFLICKKGDTHLPSARSHSFGVTVSHKNASPCASLKSRKCSTAHTSGKTNYF